MVERYLPGMTANELDSISARLVGATQKLALHGVAVRYVSSSFVPEEESCFCKFEGRTADDVRLVCQEAGLPYARIVETHDVSPSGG